MNTETKYHVALAEGAQVQMTAEQICAAYAAGKLAPDLAVWRDGFKDWTPIGELAELNLPERRLPLAPPPRRPRSDADETVRATRAMCVPRSEAPPKIGVGFLAPILIVGGLLLMMYFIVGYDTTVATPNEFGFGQRVHNIGRMQNRTLGAAVGGFLVLLGGIAIFVRRR